METGVAEGVRPDRAGDGADKGGRLGERLVTLGLISKDQLEVALHEKRRSTKMLGTILIDFGFITEATLAAVLADRTGLRRIDLKAAVLDTRLVQQVPKEVATRYRLIPIAISDLGLEVAMADPYDVLAMDQVRRFFPRDLDLIPRVASDTEIREAIDQYYGYEMSIEGIMRELETGVADAAALSDESGRFVHPVVRLVNALLLDAIQSGASDLHFEPEGTFLRLRYRIDGVMQQVRAFHKEHWPAVSHRLKIMAGMNIADTRNPQDGRFSFSIGSREIDFRVSALPTIHGENIVIRVLDRSRSLIDLAALGFGATVEQRLKRLLKRPEGMVIVTGPTGSGKTTSLYAMLNAVNGTDVNIMTLEDPVELQISLVRQAQVREGTGLTFSEGIRSLLRQDPDIILVGEVRDADTARMALRAAMTGHQVYTTLHTNDAFGVIPRLLDYGLTPNMLAGNVICAVAQRLARKLCRDCARRRPATEDECRILGVDPAHPPEIGEAVGCEACRFTGYRGRVAVAELLQFSPELDELIAHGATRAGLIQLACEQGYRSMAEDGIGKVLAGEISLESLMRAVDITGRL